MKQFDLIMIGGIAVFALFLEAGAAAYAPNQSIRQLALYSTVPMHRYMEVAEVRPRTAAHGMKQAGRRMARLHGKTRGEGKHRHGKTKHAAHAKNRH